MVVPAATPVTIPVVPMVATLVLVLLHEPPGEASERVSVAPKHRDSVPLIAPVAGATFTETGAVAMTVPHELLTVYVIKVVPVEMPVTIPDDPTVAIPALPLFHVPPAEASVNAIDEPIHTTDGPTILPASGTESMVTTAVAAAVPQAVVTV